MTQVDKQTGLIGAIRSCGSWRDIQACWRTFPEKQKGDLFEELVKAYLQLEPEYASKLKHVWLGGEVPQAIARKLKLPATDQGIDIVAENPTVVYSKQGWAGMGDRLGTGNIAFWKKVYRPFKEARVFVRGLRLKSNREWRELCKGAIPEKGALPSGIPSNPNNTYPKKENGHVSGTPLNGAAGDDDRW